MTALVPWILAHGLAALAIISAVGTLAGVVEKYTTGKASNIAGVIAGTLVDIVKIAGQIYALLGGQPPTSPMGKRLTRGVFDDTTGNGPPIVLGKDSGKLPGMKMIALVAAVVIGVGACKLVAPTAAEVACVSGQIAQDPNIDPQTLLTKCALPSLDLLEQIVELVLGQFTTAQASDAGLVAAHAPPELQTAALALKAKIAAARGAQ